MSEEATQPESISLNDLQLCLQVIDLATERGAFRGPELSQIGAVRDKLATFLDFVAAAQAEAQQKKLRKSQDSAEESNFSGSASGSLKLQWQVV